VVTEVPLVTSTALRSYAGETVVIPLGAGTLEGAIVTFTSAATLLGAKVSVAVASGVLIVPPSVAEISVGGGESPLAVLAVGLGGVGGAGDGVALGISAGVA
jgi:hypothetical protein